jgi:hypothetical protein
VNEGLTWERPVLLSNVEQSTTERPSIAVDLYGNVYAGWINFIPTTNTNFFIRRSTDGGASFGPIIALSPVVIVPSPLPVPGYAFRCLTWPNLAADTSLNPQTSNTLYAVWQDYRLGYADIFMSKSRDQGITWSSPVKVTDSPAGSQNFFPAIDVSPKTGAIKIIYYTNKLSGFFLDVFVAESNNGGTTFVNSRVTTTSFNPNGTNPVPTPVIGDYIDVSIVPTQNFIAVWMDTRTGAQTIFAGNLAP